MSLVGYYLYTEAGYANSDLIQNLYTKEYPYTGDVCMSFWYHMFGRNTGTLEIHVIYKNNSYQNKRVWSLSGKKHTSLCAVWVLQMPVHKIL